MLIDEKNQARNVSLTVAIDAETRMICGFNLDYEVPSWESVMETLRMAALPKDLSDVSGSSP